MSLKKSDFLLFKPQVTKVDVPELGGEVYVKKWNTKERIEFIRQAVKIENGQAVMDPAIFFDMTKLLQITLCDEEGERIFDDSEEDYNTLMKQDGEAVQRLYDISAELNGIKSTSTEDAAKNSTTTQS